MAPFQASVVVVFVLIGLISDSVSDGHIRRQAGGAPWRDKGSPVKISAQFYDSVSTF